MSVRIDLDLQGLIRIRLLDASPDDLEAIHRELGPLRPAALRDAEPDLCLRFVENLRPPDLRFVEPRKSGFAADGFFLRGGPTEGAWARIPFGVETSPVELVCERRGQFLPLLPDFVKVVAARKGLVPLHASAFVHRGTGILATGWAHSGKSSALLAFARRGAEFLADDLVLLAPDGGRMFGIAAPIELSGWQVRQVPRAWSRIGRRRRSGFRGMRALEQAIHPVARSRPALLRWMGATLPGLERRLRVRLAPNDVCERLHDGPARPHKLFVMMTHEADEIRVEPGDHAEAVQRLVHLARYEALSLRSHCLAYGFAFPGPQAELLANAVETGAERLRQALSGVETYVVSHPRPVSLDRLYEAMEPACARMPYPTGAAAVIP